MSKPIKPPVDLTLTIGSSVSVAAQAPAPGIYNYFYQLGPARGQYSALWKFSQPIIGGDGTGNVGGAQLGVWCYPAPSSTQHPPFLRVSFPMFVLTQSQPLFPFQLCFLTMLVIWIGAELHQWHLLTHHH